MTASQNQIRDLLGSIVGPEVVGAVSDDELIFERGIVDSLHLVEVVTALESLYGLEVQGDELAPENFESIAAIARYVDRKAGATAGR